MYSPGLGELVPPRVRPRRDVRACEHVLSCRHHRATACAAMVAGLRPVVLSDGHQADLILSAISGRSVMRTATRWSRMNDSMSASASTVHTQAGMFARAQ